MRRLTGPDEAVSTMYEAVVVELVGLEKEEQILLLLILIHL